MDPTQDFEAQSQEMTIENLRAHRDQLKQIAEFGAKVRRLADTPEFREVFMEQIFKTEPVRMVAMLGSNRLDEVQREKLIKEMEAIGGIQAMLSGYVAEGYRADSDLEQADYTIAEYEAEIAGMQQ